MSAARAGVQYQIEKSFGNINSLGEIPLAPLMRATNGTLYGTTSAGGLANSGTVFRLNEDGSGYQVLHHFGGGTNDGAAPQAGLVIGNDGALYGTTENGGTNSLGTIFKLKPDGSGYTNLHAFTSGDGSNPRAGLLQGSDGALYGAAYSGGGQGFGTVFKLNEDGGGYAVLHSFGSTNTDGKNPFCSLTEGSDGALYGTTLLGGGQNIGTVFKLNKDGTNYTVLHEFTGGDGSTPASALIQATNGMLYGTTAFGGAHGAGTVFQLSTNGNAYAVAHDFINIVSDGANPQAALVQGSDGTFYGATRFGGGNNAGVVFRLSNGTYSNLVSFGSSSGDGRTPLAALITGTNGTLFGTTAAGGGSGFGTVFKVNQDGSNYAVLHSFDATGGDGSSPQATLLTGSDGALYGTTFNGGYYTNGIVYKLNNNGSGYTILYSFNDAAGDGKNPRSTLVEGTDGALYGTAYQGGLYGLGTVFKLNKNGGNYSVLHAFGLGNDGQNPRTGLLRASNGALYGVTYFGGDNGVGTIFRLNQDGSGYTNLHSFALGGDGQNPLGALIQASDGALYGTTYAGGTNDGGAVFTLNLDGSGLNILHSFSGNLTTADGFEPEAGLMEGTDGALYGTTSQGGAGQLGTVFKLNKDGGGFGLLHNFANDGSDGWLPQAGLVQGADGALYGTTVFGGMANAGAIYSLNRDGGNYQVLHSFGVSGGDGQNPYAALMINSKIAFYGTTTAGGNLGLGTVFQMLLPGAPAITGITVANNSVQVIFTGMSGDNYELLRSTNLVNWSVLTNITMNASGVFTNVDNSPPQPAAFYQAVWIP